MFNMEENHTSNASTLTRNIRITVLLNNLQEVNDICQKKMTKEIYSDFEKKYGQIKDFLYATSQLMTLFIEENILPWIDVNHILISRCFDPCTKCGGHITLLVHKSYSIEK